MPAVVIEGKVCIPGWVQDLESFCRWACSSDYPQHGWFSYLNGKVWVDLSLEELNHNQVKGAFAIVVGSLVNRGQLGRFFCDRMGLSSQAANLATEPDGMFASRDSFRSGRAQFVAGDGDSPIRIEGAVDMALEVVSPTSVQKDMEELRELYWQAGLREYWLVDVRGERLDFDILRHTAKGYVATRRQAGWIKSAVLGKSFRLTRETSADGYPEYRLEVRG